MTTETNSDVKNDISLLPANLLTMKSKAAIPPHLSAFYQLIFTVKSVGEKFNILQMNFGRDGAKSYWEHCKNEKLQDSKEKLSKWRYCIAENQNSSKTLARSLHD